MTTVDIHDVFGSERGDSFDIRKAYILGLLSELVYPKSDEEREAYERFKSVNRSNKKYRSKLWGLFFRQETKSNTDHDTSDLIAALGDFARIEAERIERDLLSYGFDKVQFFSGASTQCFLAGKGEIVILCFRGTEPARLWDIYADLMALPVSAFGIAGLLHGGFWSALKEVWQDPEMPPLIWPEENEDRFQSDLREAIKQFVDPVRSPRVLLCGHSLGGALATLAASRLVADGVLEHEDILGIYTFGQPRVGDADFCRGYPFHRRHFRVVNANDIVSRVPPESLRLVESTLRKFLGAETDGFEKASWLSRLSYRHVGRLVLIGKHFEPVLGGSKWGVIKLQLMERIKALSGTRPWMARVFPGVSDHSMSKYNSVLSKALARHVTTSFSENYHSEEGFMSGPENSGELGRPTPVWISIFSSVGAGLLIGYLVGMAVSEVVGIFVGGLATGLAALLGLSDRNFTMAKGVRIGTFCFSAIAGALIGTTIRTHQLLSPQVSEPTLADVKQEYVDLGFDKTEVLGLLKNYINAQNNVRTTIAQNSTLSKAQTTAHFSGGVTLSVCDQLTTPHDKTLSAEQVVRNFRLEGGQGWAGFAELVEVEISEPNRKEVLFTARDAMCNSDQPLTLVPETCAKLDIITDSRSLTDIEAALIQDDLLASTLSRVKNLSIAEDRIKALVLILELSCSLKE